jgi:hypothetical protein
MTDARDQALARIADAAVGDGVVSAVIFTVPAAGGPLRLAAAAGVDGLPLQRLVEAVRSPEHPIARTLADGFATFDVRPTAPGGPALRSHLPIARAAGSGGRPFGVLAVAHDAPLGETARRRLDDLATSAAASID